MLTKIFLFLTDTFPNKTKIKDLIVFAEALTSVVAGLKNYLQTHRNILLATADQFLCEGFVSYGPLEEQFSQLFFFFL